MAVSQISEAIDAPASIDRILVLISKLESAQAAEDDARRAHGAACLEHERGNDKVDVSATADRLNAAVARRHDLESAIEAARLAASATQAEHQAAAECELHDKVDVLLRMRESAVEELQAACENFAAALARVTDLTRDVRTLAPGRMLACVGPMWGCEATAALRYLYGRTGGQIRVHGGVPFSPYEERTNRPDMATQARSDHDTIRSTWA